MFFPAIKYIKVTSSTPWKPGKKRSKCTAILGFKYTWKQGERKRTCPELARTGPAHVFIKGYH